VEAAGRETGAYNGQDNLSKGFLDPAAISIIDFTVHLKHQLSDTGPGQYLVKFPEITVAGTLDDFL